MLEITKTTITQEARKITKNGQYSLSVSICNSTIVNLTCNIYTQVKIPVTVEEKEQQTEQQIYLGRISLRDGNQLNCNFPYSRGIAKYLDDFDDIIAEITSSPEKSRDNTNTQENES